MIVFLLCIIAWMCFCCGVINLAYEVYKFTLAQDDSVISNESRWASIFRWIFSSLMFAIWYSLLF